MLKISQVHPAPSTPSSPDKNHKHLSSLALVTCSQYLGMYVCVQLVSPDSNTAETPDSCGGDTEVSVEVCVVIADQSTP